MRLTAAAVCVGGDVRGQFNPMKIILSDRFLQVSPASIFSFSESLFLFLFEEADEHSFWKEKNVRTENSHQVVIEKYSYRTFYNFFPNEDELAVHRTVRQMKIILSVRCFNSI